MPGFAERLARKARDASVALKAEYEAGKRGETEPPQPIWATPKQQLEAILAWMGGKHPADSDVADGPVQPDTRSAEPTQTVGMEPTEAELDEIATQLGGVDWATVRSSVGERSGEAADAVRAMAARVDWDRVQPVAAQVSSALITAVAAGKLPVGGRLGPIIAQAIAGQSAIGHRLASKTSLPTDLRRIIDATATPVDPTPPALKP